MNDSKFFLWSSSDQELEAARALQSRVLPRQLPHRDGLDYYGECRPAGKVGGDFFDFVALPDNVLAVSLGDVSGDGMRAATRMSGLQKFLRGLTARRGEPVMHIVEEANREVCRASHTDFYATLFYAHVDTQRHQLHYVSAGHEPPLLVRRGRGIQRLDGSGTVLGLTARSTYERHVLEFEPGDVFVACTDGVTAASDAGGRPLGQTGLADVVQGGVRSRALDLVCRVLEETDRFTDYSAPADDRTVLAIRFTDAAAHATEEDRDAVELASAAA